MPHKYNADRRHRIPKARYKVTNWRDYEAGLRKRGSLTIWFSEDAVRSLAGGAADHAGRSGALLGSRNRDIADPEDSVSPAAAPDRRVGRLAARADGAGSAGARPFDIEPAGQDTGGGSPGRAASGPVHLLVDSTGVKLSGPGEWLVEKHGTQRRRAWRKLHLGIDAKTGMIVASTLTSKEVDDAAELGALLDQVDDPLAAVIADGAYDQDRVYDDVAEHSAEAAVVVPPRSTAVLSPSAETDPTQRDRHIQAIAEQGRMSWQQTSGYNARAGAEGAMSRYKRIIGDTLRSHTRPAQEVETRIAVTVLNRMLDLGRPESVRAA